MPVKPSTQPLLDLMRELLGSPGAPQKYVLSLRELRRVSPDLWLPAIPVHGQNANLYDRDWIEVLDRNAQLFP